MYLMYCVFFFFSRDVIINDTRYNIGRHKTVDIVLQSKKTCLSRKKILTFYIIILYTRFAFSNSKYTNCWIFILMDITICDCYLAVAAGILQKFQITLKLFFFYNYLNISTNSPTYYYCVKRVFINGLVASRLLYLDDKKTGF